MWVNKIKSKKETLNLFLIGAGLIGGTLLKQIKAQQKILEKNHGLILKVISVMDKNGSLFNKKGLSLKDWQFKLQSLDQKLDLKKIIRKIIDLKLPNSIFVDCTASDEVIKFYEKLLKNKISIVTPNKKANASSFKLYQKLKKLSTEKIKFFYETNVGAGLPVIGPINNLILSGDKIKKIEGVFSGTLSYIFNEFNSKKNFSEVVLKAKQKGYTEPDPRDDLNGIDVGRKLLILAREIGYKLELKDVKIESLLNKECEEAASVEDFFQKLKKYDKVFRELVKKAEAKNQKLRYIANFKNSKAQVKLMRVNKNHPAYDLTGSDNLISITTDYYKDTPLVIKGPGAGAEVTAAGVFTDIIRVSNYLN